MNRIRAANSVAFNLRSVSPGSAGGTPQYATDGDPQAGIPPTLWPAYAYNMVQDEILNVILKAGLTPDDTNWSQLLQAIQSLGRVRLYNNAVLYVDPAGNDANPGTSAAPFKTLTGAWNALAIFYDCGGYIPTISMAAGTYPGATLALAPTGSSQVNIVGAGASTILAGDNAPGLLINSGTQINIGNLVLNATGTPGPYGAAGMGLCILSHSTVGLIPSAPISFAACGAIHLNLSGGGTFISGGNAYTIAGSAPVHVECAPMSYAALSYSTITLAGSPAFSQHFAVVSGSGAQLDTVSTVFSGSATGSRYFVANNGVINTNAAGANSLPGSSSGSTSNGLIV